jgi:RNA polymerase sigma-70 factor (ECF subfamily)
MTAIAELKPLEALTRETLTDEEIIRRVIAGEPSLFELIMRRHNQRIYRTVRSIVRDDFEAEDVMQQAYINAYTHLDQFEERASFSTWLTRIAINESFARVRPRPLRIADDLDDRAMEQIQSTDLDPEQRLASAELRALVESEIAALPESYRVVLMLREIEGLDTREVAECLGVSEDVVKTRLYRAREILRENVYRRAGMTFESLFTFGNSRCDRMVANVMESIRRV